MSRLHELSTTLGTTKKVYLHIWFYVHQARNQWEIQSVLSHEFILDLIKSLREPHLYSADVMHSQHILQECQS